MRISVKYVFLSLLICLAFTSISQPVANFVANKVNGCAPLTVQFTSLSTGNPSTYLWDFGNGNTSTLINPSASYVNPGKYTVRLTVTNAAGSNQKTVNNYIDVYPLPSVKFGALKLTGCSPLSVQFRDSSSAVLTGLKTWAWDFGDGNVSNQRHPTNTFNLPGNYSISLLVTDSNNCSNSLIKNNYINVQTQPIVDFVASSNFGCSLPFQPSFTPSITPSTGNYSYLWNFGNTTQSTSANPQATYNSKGTFPVSLRLVNQAQCTVNVVKPNFIRLIDVVPDFVIDGTPDLCAPGNVRVLNATTFDTLGIVFEWYLNGVLVSSFKNVQLTNLPVGNHSLELRVRVGNCIASTIRNSFINVIPGPKSNFFTDKTNYCKIPSSVSFKDSSSNAVDWLWNFGNAQTASLKDPIVNYTNFGEYTVRLITTHANGCRDTLVKPLYIKIKPAFVLPLVSPKKGCAPLLVNFGVYDTNSPPFNNFLWNLGKPGVTSNLASHTYTYTDTGVYYVSLTATNAEGCVSTRFDTIRVGLVLNPDFTVPKIVFCYGEQPVSLQIPNHLRIPGFGYTWVSKDSSFTGSALNNTIFFNDTGWQSLSLLMSHNGCTSGIFKDSVFRILGPIARYSFNYLPCSNSQLRFINRSVGGNKFLWVFGDGDSSTQFSPNHDYDSSATYMVKLFAFDTLTSCTSVFTLPVKVEVGMNPKFNISSKKGCFPLLVSLVNTTSPMTNIVKTEFIIDGKTLVGNSVSALLLNPGKYSVTMVLTDNKGCSFSLTKTDSIQVINANVEFASSPNISCLPLLLTTQDTSQSDFPIVKRIWTWGNGDSTVYTHPDSVFARYLYQTPPVNQADGFFLRLTIQDSEGCRFFNSKRIFLSKPLPDFSFLQKKNCVKDTFIFTPKPDAQMGLGALSFDWKILGNSFTSRTASLQYSGDTILPVLLRVTDVNGCRDSITRNVPVLTGPPKVLFDANPKVINCPGPPIFFTDFSTAGSTPILSWQWNFGDGGQSDLQNPARIYLLAGTYSVSLTVTDSLGCKATQSIPDMLVIGGPKGNYSITPDFGCAPLKVEMKSNSTNVVKFEWDFGDGILDTNANTSHIYTRDGRFIPSLTLVDSAGCKIGLPPIDTIMVLPNPQVSFSVSKKINCLGADVEIKGNVTSVNAVTSYLWKIDTNTFSFQGPINYNCNRVGDIPVLFEVTDINNCKGILIDSFAIQVFRDSIAPLKPTPLRASVVNDEQVDFSFNRSPEADFDHYLIQFDFNGEIPNQTRTITDILDTIPVFSNLNTRFYTYSYKMQTVDACRNVSEISEKHTTMELKAKGITNAVSLKWLPYLGWDTIWAYEIFRLNTSNNLFEIIGRVNDTTLNFIDSQTYCHKLFTYKIKAINSSKSSWSDTASAIPLFDANTPNTRTLRVTVEDNGSVLLQWFKRKHKYPFKYVINRYSNDPIRRNKRIELSSLDSFYIDKDVDVNAFSYSYYVQLEDECGGIGLPSNEAKTILLLVDIEKNDKLTEDPKIYWNAYQDWASGISRYDVFFYNDSIGTMQLIASKKETDSLETSHAYLNFKQDDYCYRVVAYQKDSNWVESWSNIACMATKPRLFAPNAFTANADKINDGFLLKGVFIKQYNLRIYDRWGTLVFETNNLNQAWDGTFGNEPAPAGVYVFIANAYGRKGDYVTLKGNVTLLR
jgi:gliding motility-associated-like protein